MAHPTFLHTDYTSKENKSQYTSVKLNMKKFQGIFNHLNDIYINCICLNFPNYIQFQIHISCFKIFKNYYLLVYTYKYIFINNRIYFNVNKAKTIAVLIITLNTFAKNFIITDKGNSGLKDPFSIRMFL